MPECTAGYTWFIPEVAFPSMGHHYAASIGRLARKNKARKRMVRLRTCNKSYMSFNSPNFWFGFGKSKIRGILACSSAIICDLSALLGIWSCSGYKLKAPSRKSLYSSPARGCLLFFPFSPQWVEFGHLIWTPCDLPSPFRRGTPLQEINQRGQLAKFNTINVSSY